ncbi:hypothetical protein HYC85_007193 [Camellia sinensis]|uniref:UDP-glycosyltransferases domain-containing protein n=1 Tax=Camellia sinensis TaxID=4442 RepID=A0A7J7HPI6_CAMSI|nr:hypothetical protein HYC85_007193 [Camellia sinensis]
MNHISRQRSVKLLTPHITINVAHHSIYYDNTSPPEQDPLILSKASYNIGFRQGEQVGRDNEMIAKGYKQTLISDGLDLLGLALGSLDQSDPSTGTNERGNEVVNYIPGIPPTCIADLPTIFYGALRNVLHLALEAISMVPNAQYFLLTSIYELESHTIDTLKQTIPIPIYSIGPAIPYFKLGDNENLSNNFYMQWLDSQPKASVLYISQGSFLSVSAAQMDEIIAGVHDSSIRIFWVARDEASRIKEAGCGDNGLVVSWCDQLNVLCYPSVGGFWSHCGWNSIKEGIFAGLLFLTYPIFLDQVPNSKTVVEDWKIGWKVRRGMGDEMHLVTREEIARLVQRFMDSETDEGKEMRRRAAELKETCRQATSVGGSAETNIDAFIKDISQSHDH